jgi:hypothetical protein
MPATKTVTEDDRNINTSSMLYNNSPDNTIRLQDRTVEHLLGEPEG